jgi:lipopolysaccharide export system protein LptA
MILLLLLMPYKISSGSMEVIDRNLNVFKGGIEVTTEDLYITGGEAFQTDTSVVIRDNVLVRSKNFNLTADCLNYKVPYNILYGSGNIRIWREDTLKGDSLIFFREKEAGSLSGNLLYVSDSIKVKGNSADFSKDSVIIRGKPEFESPRIKIIADYTVYLNRDSIYKFLSNVNFESSKIFGKAGKLIHNIKNETSTLIDKPLVMEDKDSIAGDTITVHHKTKLLQALNGKVVTHIEDGKNTVWGDTVDIYYNEESIDSVSVKGRTKGRFIKNGTPSGESG